jgi:hypothetical protein
VIFHDLGAQAVDSAAQRGNQHQYVGAAEFGIKRPLDGFDLSFDASDASDQFGFVFYRVCHAASPSL